AEHFTNEGSEGAHRSTQLTAEYLDQLIQLFIARLVVDVYAESPVSSSHHFGRIGDDGDLTARDIRAFDLTPLDIEHQGYPAEVVGSTMVERQITRTHQLTRTGFDITAG